MAFTSQLRFVAHTGSCDSCLTRAVDTSENASTAISDSLQLVPASIYSYPLTDPRESGRTMSNV